MNGRKWTPDEITFLVENYGKMTAKRIAEELDRSVSAVSTAIKKMGLHKERLAKKDAAPEAAEPEPILLSKDEQAKKDEIELRPVCVTCRWREMIGTNTSHKKTRHNSMCAYANHHDVGECRPGQISDDGLRCPGYEPAAIKDQPCRKEAKQPEPKQAKQTEAKRGVTSRFVLYDAYEAEHELIGTFSTIEGARAAARQRDEETDGEWLPLLYEKTESIIPITSWRY